MSSVDAVIQGYIDRCSDLEAEIARLQKQIRAAQRTIVKQAERHDDDQTEIARLRELRSAALAFHAIRERPEVEMTDALFRSDKAVAKRFRAACEKETRR